MMSSHVVLLPVVVPLFGAAGALLLFRRPRARAIWAMAAMLASFGFSLALLSAVWRGGQPVVFQSGGWPFPFGISLVGDPLSALFVVMAQLVLATGIFYALGSREAVVTYPPFYAVFLLLAAALTGVFLTGDLFNLFVFAELLGA